MNKQRILFSFIFLLVFIRGYSAGDTLHVTLARADSMLIKNNLSLIAGMYDVDAARAQEIQAKVFVNPVVSAGMSMYNPESGNWFDLGHTGNLNLSVEQVFGLAGKRNAAIKMAKETTKMTAAEYADLMRTLKYQLHQSFYTVYFLSEAVHLLNTQLDLLNATIIGYKEQYNKGNISMKDYSRLEASYLQLSRDKLDISSVIKENQKNLRILLAFSGVVAPEPSTQEIARYDYKKLNLPVLVSMAMENRPDLQAGENREKQQEFNLQMQKRIAVPDLTLGVAYDENGGYVKNYNALTVSIPVPVFDRNRGNIRSAEAMVSQAKINNALARQQVEADVSSAWSKVVEFDAERSRIDPTFISQIDELSNSIIVNYKNKNISLLEFTDLFEAYSQAVIDYYQLNANCVGAYEELDYAEGVELFK